MTGQKNFCTMVSDRQKTAVLWLTYLNIVLYALCYQLQRPVEPYLVQNLTVRSGNPPDDVALSYGRLQSFFSTIQTIGSPLVGILLDRIGIRLTSALVFLSSAISYGILALATDMNMLFYSKVPTVLQHAFLVAQAAAASSTVGNESARAQALGRMTTAYTVGGMYRNSVTFIELIDTQLSLSNDRSGSRGIPC